MKKQLIALVLIFGIHQVTATCFDIYNNTDSSVDLTLIYNVGSDSKITVDSAKMKSQCETEGKTLLHLTKLKINSDKKPIFDIDFKSLKDTNNIKGNGPLVGDGIIKIFNSKDAYCLRFIPNKTSLWKEFSIYTGPKTNNIATIDKHGLCQKLSFTCTIGGSCATVFKDRFQISRNQITSAAANIEKELFDLIDQPEYKPIQTISDSKFEYIRNQADNIIKNAAKTITDVNHVNLSSKFITIYSQAYQNALWTTKRLSPSADIKNHIKKKVADYIDKISDQNDIFDQACRAITGDTSSTPCFSEYL